jgi:uncharacterized protein DUF4843
MRSFVTYLFIAAGALMLFACKKESVPLYSGISAVFFSNTTDSSKITFAYDLSTKKDSIINIRVYTTGQLADTDREFKLIVDTSLTNALANTHYQILTQKFIIKAGTAFTNVQVKLLRTPEMVSKTYSIIIKLMPTESFTTDYSWDWVSVSKGTWRPITRYTITVDDFFSKPKNWQDAVFGPYTRTKLNAISDFFEIEMPMWNIQGAGGYAAVAWGVFGKVFQRYLTDEATAGHIILDEDGKQMAMGPSSL